jgi:hypothetical protein
MIAGIYPGGAYVGGGTPFAGGTVPPPHIRVPPAAVRMQDDWNTPTKSSGLIITDSESNLTTKEASD